MRLFGLNRKVIAIGAAIGFGLAASVFAAPQTRSRSTAGAAARATSVTRAGTSAGNGAENVRAGTKVSTQLEGALDARTAKPGQKVKARVRKNVKEHGRTVIHKGDTLIGHVTNVKSSASGKAGSQIGVSFDQLESHGATVPLNAVVTSVFSAQGAAGMSPEPMSMPEPAPMAMPAGGAGGGGLLGGVGAAAGSSIGAVGGVAGGVGSTAGIAGGAALGGHGGVGLATPIHAIHLSSEASGGASASSNSMLSTHRGNLRLDSGTRMDLRVVGQTQAGAVGKRH
jgi:hypothetical protein